MNIKWTLQRNEQSYSDLGQRALGAAARCSYLILTFGTDPHAFRNGFQRGVQAVQVVNTRTRVAHEQLPTAPAHSAEVLMDVSLWNNRTHQFPALPQGAEPPTMWAEPPGTVGGATRHRGRSHPTPWAEPRYTVGVVIQQCGWSHAT